MLTDFQLKLPGIVYCGKEALEKLKEIVGDNYRKVAIFTDQGVKRAGILREPLQILAETGTESVVFDNIPAEPTYEQAQQFADSFRDSDAAFIIAIGGGSVMDLAKLSSIAATKEYTIQELLENPSKGRKINKTLMIPTTAGTGAEATPNAIVAVPEKELKVGIVNEEMVPDYVILDGRMCAKLPKKIAAATGIDALAHAVECFTSNKANPFSNMFAMEAMKLIFANIEKACEDENALQEKSNMLLAAFYGGVAIASSGTTAVHALSYPLGGKYHIPHGVSNAMMLMPVMKFNKIACLAEFSEIYDVIENGGNRIEEEKADWVLERMHEIILKLEIPNSLKAYGIGKKDLNTLVQAGMEVKRLLANNKRLVTEADARELYLQIM